MKQLWRALMGLFTRPKTPRWQIVEVEKGVKYDGEDDHLIATLSHHPGMAALLNRFKLKRAVLEMQLRTRQKDIRDVDYLIAGIYWLGFAESEIRSATNKIETSRTTPVAQYAELEFEKARTAIESIGYTKVE